MTIKNFFQVRPPGMAETPYDKNNIDRNNSKQDIQIYIHDNNVQQCVKLKSETYHTAFINTDSSPSLTSHPDAIQSLHDGVPINIITLKSKNSSNLYNHSNACENSAVHPLRMSSLKIADGNKVNKCARKPYFGRHKTGQYFNFPRIQDRCFIHITSIRNQIFGIFCKYITITTTKV